MINPHIEDGSADPSHGRGRAPDEKDEPKDEKKKRKKKKDKGLGSARGIETMFRTSYQTHNSLSALADTKANIMISINGIIISIMIASLGPALDEAGPWLVVPLAVLLLGCLISLVFAVLSARPRITRREVTVEDALAGKTNILFFGNFVGLSEEEFVDGMKGLMANPERVYQNMMRDIYSLGHVLERKFRLLRVSYTAFMIGLVLGVLLLLLGLPLS